MDSILPLIIIILIAYIVAAFSNTYTILITKSPFITYIKPYLITYNVVYFIVLTIVITDALSTILRLLREELEAASWLIEVRSRMEPIELCDKW